MTSRLVDKMIAAKDLPDWLSKIALEKPLIDATNVYEYLAPNQQFRMTIGDELRSLPKITCPFHKCFVEYLPEHNAPQIGSFVIQKEVTNNPFAKWQLKIVSGGMNIKGGTYCSGIVSWWIDETGQMTLSPNENIWEIEYSPESNPEMESFLLTNSSVVLWTLAFMNTKNVVMEAIEPNAAENKRRAKHNKPPLMRYHVLKIKPMGRRYDNEPQGGTHASPALHIRRGHFKTYTDDAPLLGKHVGTYWWEQSIAGIKNDHIVIKDYAIEKVDK